MAARQRLIEAETKRQETIRRAQQDFLNEQLAEQHDEEKEEITEMNERRQDYLESRALAQEMAKVKAEREQNTKVFPCDGE